METYDFVLRMTLLIIAGSILLVALVSAMKKGKFDNPEIVAAVLSALGIVTATSY